MYAFFCFHSNWDLFHLMSIFIFFIFLIFFFFVDPVLLTNGTWPFSAILFFKFNFSFFFAYLVELHVTFHYKKTLFMSKKTFVKLVIKILFNFSTELFYQKRVFFKIISAKKFQFIGAKESIYIEIFKFSYIDIHLKQMRPEYKEVH